MLFLLSLIIGALFLTLSGMKTDESVASAYRERVAVTAELIDAGVALMRQNLRRKHPDSTPSEIEGLLQAWLCREDDPVPGDTAGAVRVRERAL